jgi:UDP-N-acetylmuramoyl-L-alanyl-D-glutamate--2,6-diaminopimelate ligase
VSQGPTALSQPTDLQNLYTAATRLGLTGQIVGDPSIGVLGLCDDSRRVKAGDLFLAFPGTHTKGLDFVGAALASGAVGYVGAVPESGSLAAGASRIESEEPAAAVGMVAAAFYGEPSAALDLVGVTGTNGKTSITHLLEAVWTQAGVPCAVAGTIEQRWPGHRRAAAMTTAAALDLQSFLAGAVEAGATVGAIEVSSHALDQQRVAGCKFRAAVFTNLTRDHLDYHGDEDHYFASKAELFRRYLDPERGAAILNADDARVSSLASELTAADLWSFSIEPGSTARARVIEASVDLHGIRARFDLDGKQVNLQSRLLGLPNLSNLVAAAATMAALGLTPDQIAEGLSAAAPVPGRLERVGAAEGVGCVVLVDYAHTPDALQRSLQTLVEQTHDGGGQLIVVIGCGGDRDRGKRPLMGAIAAEFADLAVLTSDNPRTEDPLAILAEMEAGARDHGQRFELAEAAEQGRRGYAVEPDRLAAIEGAMRLAGSRDVVLVAGKGHEDYQEIAGQRRHFDDRETVAEIQRRFRGGGIAVESL